MEKEANQLETIRKIGIIGTNGKTTTAKMILEILKRWGLKVRYFEREEDSQNFDSVKALKNYTSSQMSTIQVALMELKPSDLEKDMDLEFDAIVHTCFDVRHLDDRGKDLLMGHHWKKVFQHLSQNGLAIVNIDDPFHIQLLNGISNRLVIPYGFSSKATMTASSIETIAPIRFTCCLQRGLTNSNDIEIEPMEFPINVQLIGRHNIQNALAAITLALYSGVPIDHIVTTLLEFPALERRLKIIYDKDIKIIDDKGKNPQSLEAAFDAIQGIDFSNIHIIKGISNLNSIWHESNATAISNWINGIESINLNTTCCLDIRKFDPNIVEKNKNEFHHHLKKNNVPFKHYNKLEETVTEVLAQIKKNDLILLLGDEGMDEGSKIINRILEREKF